MRGHQDPDGIHNAIAIAFGEVDNAVADVARELAESEPPPMFNRLMLPDNPSLVAAYEEFRAAAKEAHRTQIVAQKAAQRYAAAVKQLSEKAIAEEPTEGIT